ncbi:MAG: hypothetical protein GXO88_02830 [Chlorobi bacterium]|nr:hypothetical protein [Chlorobiota bacterium]
MNEDFNILLSKLSRFKRKYYFNKMLRGLIIGSLLIVGLFIVLDVFEYFFWTNTVVRAISFYLFVVFTLVVIASLVIKPLFKIFKLGETISMEEAAIIIGGHFPEVSDKLLNAIQLQSLIEDMDSNSVGLISAGIEQKTLELKPFPFRKAISFKTNIKYLKWLISPALLILITLIISPAFITDPAYRIVNHKTSFSKPLPYKFKLLNDSLRVVQGDDFVVKVAVEGDEMPEQVYINEGKYDFRMFAAPNSELEYRFTKLKSDIYFNILSEEVKSETYHLQVLPRPAISNFKIQLSYPRYIGGKPEVIENTGDLILPEGTKAHWYFYTKNSKRLYLINDNRTEKLESDNNLFEKSLVLKKDFDYKVVSESKDNIFSDTLSYGISVLKDKKPQIEITDAQQEFLLNYLLVSGSISDDYGFSRLLFKYRKNNGGRWVETEIPIDKNVEKQGFNHSFNTSDIKLIAGEAFEYYYEVWDNDAVNGFKSAKTAIMKYQMPSRDELNKSVDSTSNKMKDKYESSLSDFENISKEIEKLKETLFEKKNADWNDRKKIKDLLRQEKELRESMSDLQELNAKRDEIKEFLNDSPNPELQEKLQKLDEQIEKLQDTDILKKLEELSKNIDELSKDQLDKLLDNMKENQEEFMDKLEQQLEFFKQIELEQKLSKTADDLDKLAKKQDRLREKTADKKTDTEDIENDQKSLNDEFKGIQEELKKADSLNKSMSKPMDIDLQEEQQEEIGEQMEKAASNIASGKRNKSGKNQTSAAQKMKDLSEGLQMMLKQAMQQRAGEDAEQLGNLLDNLLDISFDLESLMARISETSDNDPQFNENSKNLRFLKEDYAVLHDSLQALSKRQIFIRQFVVKESNKIGNYINKSIMSVQERQIPQTTANMQYAMTSANNLALMLNESLDQMKQSMNLPGSKSGSAKCQQPGSGDSPGIQQMIKMQKSIGKGLKQSGKQKGEGENGSKGENGDAKKLAEMAAQQSELRRQMQELMDQIEGQGGNGKALQKIINEMEKQENDIVNKRISSETLERQKEIETRLLKAEKALLKREKDKKRESKEGKNMKRGNPKANFKYKMAETDNKNNIINRRPLKLQESYKKISDKYLYDLKSSEELKNK